MWLPSKPYVSCDDDLVDRNELPVKQRSNSPPLEGGESLCEFYIDYKNDTFLQGNCDMNKSKLDVTEDSKNKNDSSLTSDDAFSNKALFSFLGNGLLPVNNTFTQSFLQSILSSVDSSDSVVANAWMETLLDVIDLLPKEIIKNEILTLAINKGQLSQPVSSRLICCRMLGKLSTKFEPYIIKKELLPVALSLCQDFDYEVRGCMCRQLDVVAKGIGLETTKNAILPQLVELSNDEESFVRIAGIETVVQMLPLLDDETCVQIIIPLVQKFCDSAMHAEDSTVIIVSKYLGQLCHGLIINISYEQRLWFLNFFRKLAKLGLSDQQSEGNDSSYSPMPDIVPQLDNIDRHSECRYFCAYNIPAMVMFAGCKDFVDELHSTFSELCYDPLINVRKSMASGFYEVVNFLDVKSTVLLPELICLLKDNSLEVLRCLIPHLPDILRNVCHFAASISECKTEYIIDLIQALKTYEESISLSTNWRLHAEFLTQISCLPSCFSSEVIYTDFVPLLFVKLHTARPIPCRLASAYSLLVLLRNTQKLEWRNGIINELIRDLCNSRSCHKRMLFLKVCEIVLDLFSKAFFKKHFFRAVLNLSGDHVPNIRLRLCSLLPKLKVLMKLPKDSILLQDLETCVKNLMTDEKDVDVVAAINKAIEELDKIEVPMQPISRRTSCIDVDVEDMRKEEEEKKLIEMELNLQNIDDMKYLKSKTETRSLTRQGKIPISKGGIGGTLPKPSKMNEFKSNTLTKATSISSQIKRPTKDTTCFGQASKSNVNMKKSSTLDKMPTNPTKSTTMLSSKSLQTIHSKTFLKPSQLSNISKLPSDRCPSPMPVFRRYSDQIVTRAGNKFQETSVKLSEKRNSISGLPIPNNKTSKQSPKLPEKFNCQNKCRTPRPSPEIFRKSPSPSHGSRIPTPSFSSK